MQAGNPEPIIDQLVFVLCDGDKAVLFVVHNELRKEITVGQLIEEFERGCADEHKMA